MSTDEVKRRFNDVKLQFDFVQTIIHSALNSNSLKISDTKIRINLQLLDIKLQILELEVKSLKSDLLSTQDDKVEEIPPPPKSHWGGSKETKGLKFG